MTTHLFISLYPEKDKQRAAELRTVLMNNLKSGCFDAIWILAEDDGDGLKYLPNVNPYTVNLLPCTTRPTFRTFFNAVNNIDEMLKKNTESSIGNWDNAINVGMPIIVPMQTEENIYVVANSDIYFETIPIYPSTNQFFALTRYEVKRNGPTQFLNRSDSQDTFWVRGKVKIPKYCDFVLGRPGADNRICREMAVMGYETLNPSLTIKTFHLHEGQKSYTSETRKVEPPYLRLNPIEMS